MQVTQAAKGQAAFYRTNNSGYGTAWEAAQAAGGATNDPAEVPQYRDLVSSLVLMSLRCTVIEID